MADMTLNEALAEKGLPKEAVRKVVAYINEAKSAEARAVKSAAYKHKDKPSTPVTDNEATALIALASKYWNMGLVLDGVNVVITGRNMAMVTAHGYKNKVLQTYPESKFDMQLVRETDQFTFAKESGDVVYSHQLNDPFDNKPIIGAYIVGENRRGQFLELLNKKDYTEMKNASRQRALWDKWESEFWLKSVMKRAAKRNFYDAIAEIDADDNETYGIDENAPPAGPEVSEDITEAIELIKATESLEALRQVFRGLGRLTANPLVNDAKNAQKALFEGATNAD